MPVIQLKLSLSADSDYYAMFDGFKFQVFDELKLLQPDFSDKVVPIYCNLEEEGLGLDDTSLDLIRNEVNIFIHSAATLKFDEPLRYLI